MLNENETIESAAKVWLKKANQLLAVSEEHFGTIKKDLDEIDF